MHCGGQFGREEEGERIVVARSRGREGENRRSQVGFCNKRNQFERASEKEEKDTWGTQEESLARENCVRFSIWGRQRGRESDQEEPLARKKLCTLLDLCVSSLRRGHANLLCIVPILTDDPRRVSETRDPLRIPFCKKNAD